MEKEEKEKKENDSRNFFMPTYRQNDTSTLTVAKPLKFGKPAAQSRGAVIPSPAGPLELGFTLDTSESMTRLFAAAAEGFNGFVAEQHAAGPGFLSFNTFSDHVHEVFTGVELGAVEKIDEAFLARDIGATALLDGIGTIIGSVACRFDKLPAAGRRGALVAILTDGAENFSRKFSKERIFELIHFRRSVHHWEFLFICADEFGERYGLGLGIQKSNIVRFDTSSKGLRLLLARLSKAAGAFRLGDRNFAGYLTDRTANEH